MFNPTIAQSAAASVVALMFGVFAGWAVDFLGIFMIFLAVAYGGFAGELILRASGRRRGRKMEIITGISMVFGALAGRVLIAAIQMASVKTHSPINLLSALTDLVWPVPIPLAALIAAVASTVGKIRYL